MLQEAAGGFRPKLFRHVQGHHQDRLPPAVGEEVGVDLHLDLPPVLELVGPGAGGLEGGPWALQVFQKPKPFPLGADLEEGHGEELFPAVPVLLDRRLVHLQEAEGLPVVDPHGEGVGLEEEAEALLLGHLLRYVKGVAGEEAGLGVIAQGVP